MTNRNRMRHILFLTGWWSLFCVESALSFTSNRQHIYSTKSTTAVSSPPYHVTVVLYSFLEQRPGESDLSFIKRITTEQPVQHEQKPAQEITNSTTTVTGKYQRIEEWDAQRKVSGELTWEEKLQYEGQRFGNQIKQDSILRRHIGSFF